ncbi:MAG: tRNA (adenosine(37)-N6)-threonylcarbamoyltransferase complex dimerization subunit type 1 TsaB [Chitinophagaceae bacterium]|nr:tRNA (adenosine(37)-N6)-threonylcarbamoyltransferase complex dimerization subunit type 1 TsaB [Chitinophagaceae bacterium]
MSSKLILCIDCSVQTASVALAKDKKLLGLKICAEQKQHAGFIQPAVKELMDETGVSVKELHAVAVTNGPGSYTGLRVGMASAKGLCYALNIPLIVMGTLDVMAIAALKEIKEPSPFFICPMIDARRMEVFTTIYDEELNTVLPAQALILNEQSFAEQLNLQTVLFLGNGAEKWKTICHHANARFPAVNWNAASMTDEAFALYEQQQFASLAYAAPFYLKEFHSTAKN